MTVNDDTGITQYRKGKVTTRQNSIGTDKGLNKFFKQITGQHTLSQKKHHKTFQAFISVYALIQNKKD